MIYLVILPPDTKYLNTNAKEDLVLPQDSTI